MQNILIKIEKICQKYPEYIAVADENSQLTYKELLQEMHTIGSFVAFWSSKSTDCRVSG